MARIAVAGIDAGGTKTTGLLVDLEGRVVATSLAGPGNYQGPGAAVAEAEIRAALEPLRQAAAAQGLELAAVGYGISGWDRPRDEAIIRGIVDRVAPDLPHVLVNDMYIVLRAGTPQGVGVVVISGTGANSGGVGPNGRVERVGGLVSELGDSGGGSDIGVAALKAARRGKDGRGLPTALTAAIEQAFGLDQIEDAADWFIDEFEGHGNASPLAPLVFEAAAAGDRVARDILEAAGDELGLCARLVAARLFRPEAPLTLVLGGSVLQKPALPLMRDAIAAQLRRVYRDLSVTVLDAPPVVGGVFYALDLLKQRDALPPTFPWPSDAFQATLRATVAKGAFV